jgi:hypothetical protein
MLLTDDFRVTIIKHKRIASHLGDPLQRKAMSYLQ